MQASAELIDDEHGDQRNGVVNPRQKVGDPQICLVDPVSTLGDVHHLEAEIAPAAHGEGLVVVEAVPAGDRLAGDDQRGAIEIRFVVRAAGAKPLAGSPTA